MGQRTGRRVSQLVPQLLGLLARRVEVLSERGRALPVSSSPRARALILSDVWTRTLALFLFR